MVYFYIIESKTIIDYDNRLYTFFVLLFGFIPMELTCKWNDKNVIRNFYFLGFLVYTKELKTKHTIL